MLLAVLLTSLRFSFKINLTSIKTQTAQNIQNIITVVSYKHTHTHTHRGKLEYNIEKCPEDCFVNLGFPSLKKKTNKKLEPRSCS